MLLFGNNQIGPIFLGDNEVVSIYYGDELIYTASAPITNYVTFTAQQANSTIGLQQLSSNQKLWYSTNGEQWKKMTTDVTITLANEGDSCYIAGILNGDNTVENYTRFRMTGKIAASGNCNALWDYNNLDAHLKKYCGYLMFDGCSSLTIAPELPATALADYCYSRMFYNCTSLTTAPILPGTTLANYCYSSMFSSCRGLTAAPELPATTLADYCYQSMFYGCSNLTTAPELPATALVEGCYSGMFESCTSLNYIKCLAVDGINQNGSTYYWVYRVASSGTFVKHPDATSWPTGVDGIPTGWVVEDYMPAVKFTAQEANSTIRLSKLNSHQILEYSRDLNIWMSMTTVTTIALANSGDSCYIRGTLSADSDPDNNTHFKMTGKIAASGNCNYLWNYKNPDAPLKQYCGYHMFSSSTSLTTAPELPATALAQSCYSMMFYGCTSLTTAPELPATALANNCYFGMFSNCSSLTTAPSILPATTLPSYYCYASMFRNCTSLTTAPELPATTLTTCCYENMFNGCSRLNYIKCLATDISASICTGNWVNGVANTGVFVKHSDVTNWTTGVNGIPTGWVVEDYTPVKFTAQQANSTIGLQRLSSYQTLEYSTNGITWDNMTTATTITLENSGDSCYVRGILSSNNNYNTYTQFKMSGKIAASGNCNYLWNYKNPDAPLKQYCGYDMFSGCTSLTTAPELPATTLADSCYSNMFSGCTSLTTAPELPATTLAYSCYNSMFSDTNLLPDCTNIDFNNVTGGLIGLFAGTKVNDNDLMNILPINQNSGHYWLPATTLASFCYYNMFQGCSSLTTAPELPATTLAYGCYQYMFRGCSSLTVAPELPATTLANYCYNCMFVECTSLTTTPELPATTLTYDCYSAMFQGCTSLTAAPELPATTLADGCYSSMFRGCTSLTAAPELPATTLVQTCYFCMFEGCSNLNYIRCLAANMSASSCTYNWVSGVASVGTFVKRLDVTNWKTGVNGIPTNWTVEDAQ